MRNFPRFEYTIGDVRRAGETIAKGLVHTAETDAQIREAFKIANNWREAHAYPMRSIRHSVISFMRKSDASGITAARLKRMPAIRAKLQRVKLSLHQLQDLGGCRVILNTIEDVHRLTETLVPRIRHEIHKENDYISEPKPDGYRSRHVIFKFDDRYDRNSTFNDKRIELQIRTRIQHAWATAVEAVGLYIGEGLKNHQGSDAWLRLFYLMSGEFAEMEGTPPPMGCADRIARRAELATIARQLKAITLLDTINQGAMGTTDAILAPGYRPSHYLISYDPIARQVRVEAKREVSLAVESYDNAEQNDNLSGEESGNRVLVEVDKINNLKAAYPNYFGDVNMFTGHLRAIVHGRAAIPYERSPMPPKTPLQPQPTADLRWLRKNPFPRPDAIGKRAKRGKRKP